MPDHPKCQEVTYGKCSYQPKDENGNPIGNPVSIPCEYSPAPGGSLTFRKTGVSSQQHFAFALTQQAEATISLSGMNWNFDCRGRGIHETAASDTTPPARAVEESSSTISHHSPWTCRNQSGTGDDGWSGVLPRGEYTVTVYPYGDGTGNYTLTVTARTTAPPPPVDPLSVPAIPDFRLPSGGSVDTVFPAATGGTAPYVYSTLGLPPGITFVASTRRASGTLPTVTTDTDYTATYTVTDSASASASVTFVTTVLAPVEPSAPQLTGSVAGRPQTLTWTEPATGSGITRYQLQTRASAAHAWGFTGAGTPSPSSNISSSARSWSVTTPSGLLRHYRIRAVSANGDGAWSNVVELTST